MNENLIVEDNTIYEIDPIDKLTSISESEIQLNDSP